VTTTSGVFLAPSHSKKKTPDVLRRVVVAIIAACTWACGGGPTSPVGPPAPAGPDRAAVIDALEYWKSTIGIDYVIVESNTLPRLLIRTGTDGLGSADARGVIDATGASNAATSGLVVIRPGVSHRGVHRHEVGHALGFFDHSQDGLMAPNVAVETMSARERAMMTALYAITPGAAVQSNGTWQGPGSTSGAIADVQAALDILQFNANAVAGGTFRQPGLTCRWPGIVRVFIQS
jgi:hypothetical protein